MAHDRVDNLNEVRNYVVEDAGVDTIDVVAKKYPICWNEALKLVKAKIGNYELLHLYRDVDSKPDMKGMQYYWTVKTKQRWRKPKYYQVDAVTGRMAKVNITGTVSSDDQL